MIVWLSGVVYRNPPMPASAVVRAMEALDQAEVRTIVMGGWGVDALTGEQLRVHHDLDLIVDHRKLEQSLRALAEIGYREWFRNESPEPYGEHQMEGDVVVVRDSALRVVDLHPMRIEDLDTGASSGAITGHGVRCVSAELQLEAHSGYSKRWPSDRKHHAANIQAAQQALESNGRVAV